MIRIYRCVLLIIMFLVIGLCVWYYTYSNNEQRSTKEGTLVLHEVVKDATDGVC